MSRNPSSDAGTRSCGHTRRIDGGRVHVCELAPGHEGRHAMLNVGRPFIWWDDEPPRVIPPQDDRFDGWRKPHVRRKYQTLKQWKAERG